MLAPHHCQPCAADLKFEIDQLPGGRWIKPHYADGPWWIVIVDSLEDDAHDQVWAALRAYPATHIFPADFGVGYAQQVTAHVVPDFVRALLWWHTDEHSFMLNGDIAEGPYPEKPGDEELAALVPGLLGLSDHAALCQAVADAAANLGLSAVLTLLRNLDAFVLSDPDAVVTALTGALAHP